MAVNLPLRRRTRRCPPPSIMKCVDFLPTRFAFAKNRRPLTAMQGNVRLQPLFANNVGSLAMLLATRRASSSAPRPSGHSIAKMRICGPGSLLGVQGSWAGASHSRVIPHTTTARSHISIQRVAAKAGIELGENGSIFPRPKGKPRSQNLPCYGWMTGQGLAMKIERSLH